MNRLSTLWLTACLATVAAVGSGCSDQVQVARYDSTQIAPTNQDSAGWYHFTGFQFKGELKNGQPDGRGFCRTTYRAGAAAETTPCEFQVGVRTDAAYVARTRSIIAAAAAARERQEADDAASRRQQERERERREEAGRRAIMAGVASGLSDFNRQMPAVEAASRGSSVTRDADRARNQAMLNDVEADARADANETYTAEQTQAERERQEAAAAKSATVRVAGDEHARQAGLAKPSSDASTPTLMLTSHEGERAEQERQQAILDRANGAKAADAEHARQAAAAKAKSDAEEIAREKLAKHRQACSTEPMKSSCGCADVSVSVGGACWQ